MLDLQKASLWKRISAALFDSVLLIVIALGLALIIGPLFGYGSYSDRIEAAYTRYEEEFDVEFGISSEEYKAMLDADRERFDAAAAALEQDEDALYSYNMLVMLTLLIATFSILLAVIALEFVVPLLLGNGQSLGKKIFGIALMRVEGIKVKSLQLFIRAILGKFTIELMVPIYIVLLVLIGRIGTFGFLVLLALLIVQIVCLAVTRVGALLHDVFAGTVAVDIASQMIFETKEAKLEYIKELHAQEANKASY